MKLINLNTTKNRSNCILGKEKAYRLIIGKDEAVEIVREDDLKLKEYKDSFGHICLPNPDALAYFTQDEFRSYRFKVRVNYGYMTICEIERELAIAKKTREINTLINPKQEPKRDAIGKFAKKK